MGEVGGISHQGEVILYDHNISHIVLILESPGGISDHQQLHTHQAHDSHGQHHT